LLQGPQRIVCLTEEPTEILCALGLEERIVGISAYSVRPAGIQNRKPVVSAFLDGSVRKIAALKPDLVIGFSDIQADLAARLIKAHLPVVIFNQRSVTEILETIAMIARMVGAQHKGEQLVQMYRRRIARARQEASRRRHRPAVYFEEWDEPMICAIEWVSELIEIAGGRNIFSDRAASKGARGRVVDEQEVLDADPDVIIASWCGKPVDFDAMRDRPGFAGLSAFATGQIHELDPSIILQPGPASLTDGLDALCRIISAS